MLLNNQPNLGLLVSLDGLKGFEFFVFFLEIANAIPLAFQLFDINFFELFESDIETVDASHNFTVFFPFRPVPVTFLLAHIFFPFGQSLDFFFCHVFFEHF